jgi:hypothetical protein
VPASPNQTKYTTHLLISAEHKTQPYARPQIGTGVVVAECSGIGYNEILREKTFWRKKKPASVTKKNRGIQGTHAQSTNQGRVIVNKNTRKTGKKTSLSSKGKQELEK